MAHIINASTYQKSEQNQSVPSESSSKRDTSELGLAIQSLIQQLRKAPLH